MKVWLNGRIVDAKDAKVSVFDRGFLYGDGVFETMRAYGGKVFALEAHLARLARGLAAIRIRSPFSREALQRAVGRLIAMQGLSDAYVRISVSRGAGGPGIGLPPRPKPTVAIVARRLVPYPKSLYTKGIRAKIVDGAFNERSPVAGIKTSNYLANILARADVGLAGYDEAILTDTKGMVAEATTANCFLVKKGAVITPPVSSGILPGVTRAIVIGLCRDIGLIVTERPVGRAELFAADEVFLTNSLVEILPVTVLDRRKIPGAAIALRLLDRYRALAMR